MRIKIFISLSLVLLTVAPLTETNYFHPDKKEDKIDVNDVILLKNEWSAPDTNGIGHTEQSELIHYGRTLILHTAYFYGPKGTVAHNSNGMNCGNCHIDGGTRLWANNFSMIASTYPFYSNRSGKIETVEMRINDCFERSLNGKKPGDSGREMKAMVAYIDWVGKDVAKGTKPNGAGTEMLSFLNRAANIRKGEIVYYLMCRKCHGNNGEGALEKAGKEYLYPPLWGKHSYNVGAGIYEVSKFAGFIKNNMPFGISFNNPLLTNEQAWDVAAFVNSRPHPLKNLKMDWPDISKKPFDYPFGPYRDRFSQSQHKYGPFGPIHNPLKKVS